MTPRPMSAVRAWSLVLAMTIAAHGLWIVGAAALAAISWYFDIWFVLGLGVAFTIVLAAESILERRGRGWTVRVQDEPELVELVEDVARRAGFDQPLLLRIIPTTDAAMGYERVEGSGTMVLHLGWPYVLQLSREELSAVVAHELAHVGDLATLRGRLLNLSRNTLSDASFPIPVVSARLLSASRGDAIDTELSADAAAAAVVGPEVVAAALWRTRQVDTIFEALVGHWCEVMTDAGEYPQDVYLCASDALDDPDVAVWVDSNVRYQEEMEGTLSQLDPAETHPSLTERVTALGVEMPRGARSEPVRVFHPDRIHNWCVRDMFDPDETELRPGSISGSPEGRFDFDPAGALADLREAGQDTRTRAALGHVITRIEAGTWREVAHQLDPDLDDLDEEKAFQSSSEQAVIVNCLGTALAVPLVTAGWRRAHPWLNHFVESPEGERVHVFEVVERAVESGDVTELRRLVAAAALGSE